MLQKKYWKNENEMGKLNNTKKPEKTTKKHSKKAQKQPKNHQKQPKNDQKQGKKHRKSLKNTLNQAVFSSKKDHQKQLKHPFLALFSTNTKFLQIFYKR